MGKEMPESSRLEFLEIFLANNFALSDTEANTFGPLNRGGIADLPLLRTLLAIATIPVTQVSGKWQTFVLLAYMQVWQLQAASRTLLQRLVACLNFPLDSEDLFC